MKKILSLILSVIIIASSTAIYAKPIYSYKETTPVTNSIELTKVKEFYSGYNISYSYIKADLSDENVSMKLLKSESGADILETLGTLAKTEPNTVAAVNGDFFSLHQGKKGFSLGIEVDNEKLLQSPIYPDTMATTVYSDGKVAMDYLDFHIIITASDGSTQEARHLNKHTSYFGDILMYTKDFNGGYSPAPGGDVVEVVVSGGKVTEFRRQMPSVLIPEDGCVLVVSEGSNMFLANNFRVGDDISIDFRVSPNILKSDVAFGGGAMLVKDGNALKEFSHVISGRNPRTAIGMDKDGKTLYLVTVDGRQEQSRGMSMSELASLMQDLGCYNAINLDGGGSTRMVASTIWDKGLAVQNSPTENRPVINGVGLSFNAGKGTTTSVAIDTDKKTVYIGDKVNIKTTVYDEYMRPVDATANISSNIGTISGNVFTSNTGGTARIEAEYNGSKAYADVFVIDKVAGIDVPSHMELSQGETKAFDISVFDSNGNYAKAETALGFSITSSDTSVATVDGNKITAVGNGKAIIEIRKNSAVSFISVRAGSKSTEYVQNLEYDEGDLEVYPREIYGSFEISSDRAYSGKSSAKLGFDFTEEDNRTKGVYYRLRNPEKLSTSKDEVSLMFYSENDFKHSLRAQFTDSKGNVVRSEFGKNLKGGSWQSLSCKVPENAAKPVTLDKIYAVYVEGEEKDAGEIYIDDLTYYLMGSSSFGTAPQNIYSDNSHISGSAHFKVGMLIKNKTTLVSNLINSTIAKKASGSISSTVIASGNEFSSHEDDYALYIKLDTSKGGIRNTSSAQWDMLLNAIESSNKKNVFIMSGDTIYGSDKFENEVIDDYLESINKNVIVITGADGNSYKNVNGVKHFTLCNSEKEELSQDKLNSVKYLEFSFENGLEYEWKNVY